MKTAKQILTTWANECLGKRLTINLGDDAYAGILGDEWQKLIERVDIALREARQEGLDFRKQKKLLNEDYEFGPFWQQFYLNGGLEKPGLAEVFDCTRDDPAWLNQWNEIIRVGFKKPTLRAVAPCDFLESLKSGMNEADWLILEEFFSQVICGLIRTEEVKSEEPKWSIAALKGK